MPNGTLKTPRRHVMASASDGGVTTVAASPDVSKAAHQSFWLLRIAFTVAPILFGVDKFFNWSVHWPDYLAGWVNDIVPGSGQDLMYVVGGVEILAGLLVAFAPRIGANDHGFGDRCRSRGAAYRKAHLGGCGLYGHRGR